MPTLLRKARGPTVSPKLENPVRRANTVDSIGRGRGWLHLPPTISLARARSSQTGPGATLRRGELSQIAEGVPDVFSRKYGGGRHVKKICKFQTGKMGHVTALGRGEGTGT